MKSPSQTASLTRSFDLPNLRAHQRNDSKHHRRRDEDMADQHREELRGGTPARHVAEMTPFHDFKLHGRTDSPVRPEDSRLSRF
jgi:hypothetical protein